MRISTLLLVTGATILAGCAIPNRDAVYTARINGYVGRDLAAVVADYGQPTQRVAQAQGYSLVTFDWRAGINSWPPIGGPMAATAYCLTEFEVDPRQVVREAAYFGDIC